MRRKQILKHFLTYALILGAALITSTDVAAQKPATVVSLSELKSQLTLLQNNIAAAMDSLQQVKDSVASESALSKAAADFQNRFSALEMQSDTVRKQAIMVKATASQHYDAWQRELGSVQNPNIREKAQERFTESKKQFDKITERAERAKAEYVPFVSDMKDIVIYLQADLSPDAVKSLSNNIWKLGNKSKNVIGSIGDVTEQIDRAIKAMPKK